MFDLNPELLKLTHRGQFVALMVSSDRAMFRFQIIFLTWSHMWRTWRHDTGTWEEILTLGMWRKGGHVSWTPDTGIGTYLIGGDFYEMTTTLIKPDGTQEQGFFLKHGIK